MDAHNRAFSVKESLFSAYASTPFWKIYFFCIRECKRSRKSGAPIPPPFKAGIPFLFEVDSHLRGRLRRTAVLGIPGSDVLYSSASEGKFLGCGLDSSVFCHQSTCKALLLCGLSTSTFVKRSRRRLPIMLRVLIAARLSLSLNVCWCDIHFGYSILFSAGKLEVEGALLGNLM